MVLLFLPNGLGDLLMAVPVLRRLLAVHGAGNVAIVVADPRQGAVVEALFGEEIEWFCRFDGRQFSQFRLMIKVAIRRFKFVYAPLASRRWVVRFFLMLAGAKVFLPAAGDAPKKFLNLTFRGRGLKAFGGHQVEYYEWFCERALDKSVVTPNETLGVLLSSPGTGSRPSVVVKIAVGLSCGVKERHKIPSPEFFGLVLNQFATTRPVEVLAFGVASDEPLIERLAATLNSSVVLNRLVDASVPAAIEKLAECEVGIVGTTGQGHMMAAAGLPLLVFSGVTNPYESGPYVSRAIVVSHALACGPCYQESFGEGCGRIACMETLDSQAAVAALARLIDDPTSGLGWRDQGRGVHTRSLKEIEVALRQMGTSNRQ